ncbi:hypothetical protein VTK73DRAFT_166 [Phialemonium thermophilum]|uniref:D-xylose 1-dehydrogenase (NADP(+), D-xylono-1,5-lactone-forming) n=1 Tax=Phialemonium thermophilum TaxID=223376 RepID=A0ABR3VWM5_9PEZI
MSSQIPTLRWGIIATGLISSWFVQDLSLERADAKAHHIIQAIGSSSVEKGRAFAAKHIPGKSPTIYGSYDEVYSDRAVDIVYVGTPHAFHKQNCLDAIKQGKHVLCEKAFTLTAAEAREVLDAARKSGVFVMEALWTRFFPLVRTLRARVHDEKVIGDVRRVFCDFAMDMNLASLGPDSRLKNPALGAGTLLDIGIYSLTWGLLALDPRIGSQAETPKIVATQSLEDGIDVATSAILVYPNGSQGILTSHAGVKTPPAFCRIEGTQGTIVVEGWATSAPTAFVVQPPNGEAERYEFARVGRGFYWEADAVAVDIAAGKCENETMPWTETLRVMEMLDEIRRQGGARFPPGQDWESGVN